VAVRPAAAARPKRHRRRLVAVLALVGVLVVAGLIALAERSPSPVAGVNPYPHNTSGPSIVRSTPTRVVHGTPEMGPGGTPIDWSKVAPSPDATYALLPTGLSVQLTVPGAQHWTVVPVTTGFARTEILGTVRFASGTTDNALGLGCLDAAGNDEISFQIAQGGAWGIVDHPTGGGAHYIIEQGTNGDIRPTTELNELAVTCQVDPAAPDQTLVQMAVNGKALASARIGVQATAWSPTLVQCSCDGTLDTAEFTNVSQLSYGR